MSVEALRTRPYQPADEKAVVSLWLRCGLVVPHNNPLRDIRRKLKITPEWFLVARVSEKSWRLACLAMMDIAARLITWLLHQSSSGVALLRK